MRAEESSARAKKPVVELHRMTGKGTLRKVTTWLPIHHLTTDEVWQVHQDHGIARHSAHDMGMRRLSCRACPLAKTEDLIRSAQLNPSLFAEYAGAEKENGQAVQEEHQPSGRSSSEPGADPKRGSAGTMPQQIPDSASPTGARGQRRPLGQPQPLCERCPIGVQETSASSVRARWRNSATGFSRCQGAMVVVTSAT
ncbi:phosphoadenosine phosphosulfate reductase family protein [Streptomyces sp. NPDC004327]|uniref:phosphoadenosine phosphosulfate reductase domain-containing protein n=1 Tax=Streptomyces sp. NPDC004327 TaxID=3364699 RepID=UPI00368B5CF8